MQGAQMATMLQYIVGVWFFYGCQYVSYSIYCICEEFHSRIRYFSSVLINWINSLTVTPTNKSYFMSYIDYNFFLQSRLIFCKLSNFFFNQRKITSTLFSALFWNETLRFSLFFCFHPKSVSLQVFNASVGHSKYKAWDCRHSGLTVYCHFHLGVDFLVGAIVTFLFFVVLSSWVSKGAVHSSS